MATLTVLPADTALATTPGIDSFGLQIVGPGPIQVRALRDAKRSAWDTAFALAMENREDFAYPWIDETSGTLRVAVATDSGLARAQEIGVDPTIGVVIESVDVSIADLDRLGDALTRLGGTGVSDADAVFTSRNRVYTGGIGTASWDSVSTWTNVVLDDDVCANGASGGERCGWVSEVGINFHYNKDGPNVWGRNLYAAVPNPQNSCPIDGDSGGPIYWRKADGTLKAIGIQSGRGDYFWGCKFLFTLVSDAVIYFPGTVATN